jgi:hypothetical protein
LLIIHLVYLFCTIYKQFFFLEENSIGVGLVHSVNIEECISGNGIRTETAENDMGDEALACETGDTVLKSEKDVEAAAAESSINCESEKITVRETVAYQTDAVECKSEEGDVTPQSAECEMSVVTCTVKEEEGDKETEDEHFTSEVDSSMKCESRKQQGECGNREGVERSIDLKLEFDTPSDIRPLLSEMELLQKCDTVVATTEIDSVCSNVSNTAHQDLDLVQEMTVSDADHMTYEPNVVPEHDVIHESAILDSSGYIVNGDGVVQTNSDCKEGDTKTAVDVSGEVGSVSGHEDSKADEDEDAEEVQAALIAAVTGSEGCCWDVVDSTEKLLAEVPLVALEAVPVPVAVPVTLAVVEEGEAVEEVEVIPMQEELEVRLEEGTFPVAPEDALSMDWPYPVKMDSAIVTAALDDIGDGTSSTVKSMQAQYPEYSTSQAVKLELEG